MLDPLLSPEEKAEQKRLREAQKNMKKMETEDVSDVFDVPSFPESDTSSVVSVDPQQDEDISFDIGGIDLPVFDGTADSPTDVDSAG